MNSGKALLSILGIAVFILALTGCQKKEVTAEEKGPAEILGRQVDQAVVKAGEQLNEVAQQAGKELKNAGEKLQNAAQEAQKKE